MDARRPPVYDELGTPAEMAADGRAAGRRLERAARAAVTSAPSLDYDHYPREVSKREIRVDEAAARLADALHFHLH